MAYYCKILIIDDEFIMRQGLKHMVDWEKEGFEIVGEASNGKEGLQMIEQLHPHIVLCDIVMPIMDGMDFSNMVQKLHPEIQIIILSSYDNFEYVKSTLLSGAVDYVLKPTLNPEELLAVLRKAMKRIPGLKVQKDASVSNEKAMERYLLGFDATLDGLQFGTFFTNTYYRMLGFYMKRRNQKERDISADLYEQTERFWQRQDYCKNVLVVLQGEIICMVLNYNANQEQRMSEDMQLLVEQLTILYPGFFGVCSRRMNDTRGLRACYQEELLPAMEQAFYYETEHLRILEEGQAVASAIEKFDYTHYSNLLAGKNYGEATDMLDRYVQASLAIKMDEYRLKNQTKNMLYNFLESIDQEENEREQLRYEFFRMIDETDYAAGFTEVFGQIMQRLRVASNNEQLGNDKRIRQILDYIRENYNQELDLTEIANVFNFNYYYLSAYFNQHMMEGFSDYLNRVRIEQACNMLRENELTIAQISGAVGYSDHSYFCRVFKKITGETPSAWRRGNR